MYAKDLEFIHNKLFAMDENGQKSSQIDEDCDLNIGELSHPTTTVNLMGEYEIADSTRLNNFQATVTLSNGLSVWNLHNVAKDSNGIVRLLVQGIQQRVVNGLLKRVRTETRLVGNVASMGGLNYALQQSGSSAVTVNVLSLQTTYKDNDDNVYTLHDIDRTTNKLVVCGKDLREDITE